MINANLYDIAIFASVYENSGIMILNFVQQNSKTSKKG